MQNVTPHTFRHSFCCWLCENVAGENTMDDIKYIQSIMGHKDAGTTLNIYSELRQGNAAEKHEALKKEGCQNVKYKPRGSFPSVFFIPFFTPIFTPVNRVCPDF